MRIEVVVFDGFDEMDAVGPYEVLRNAANVVAGRDGEPWEVALVGAYGAGVVHASHGLRLLVDSGLGEHGQPDAIVVPGGGWGDRAPTGAWHEAQEGDLPHDLAELAPGCRWVASVCTGAMLLATAGLTRGRPATTHEVALADLRASGAMVREGVRYVDDGDLLTSAGVTAGLDLACWLVERELGPDVAAAVTREMAYERSARTTPNG
ncbi:MAG TPA: DJ-1/PfpI family protein [Actinomycetes bacterium]|nr:DJ-1/PfpI family protein [Actinomycetes bacterium]